MSRLTRDGTAEPVSRDQFSGKHGDMTIFIFPVQLTTSKIGNLTRLIHTLLYVMTIHTYFSYLPAEIGSKHKISANATYSLLFLDSYISTI